MPWRITSLAVVYYRSAAGNEPVREYLSDLADEELALIESALDDLRANGVDAANVTMRHIDGKLWELKLSAHRIFYVVIDGPTLVLLHAYRKQGQKAPRRELEVATKRMKEVLHNE
jgi:phage-related protein